VWLDLPLVHPWGVAGKEKRPGKKKGKRRLCGGVVTGGAHWLEGRGW